MSILIAGDLVPTDSNTVFFNEKKIDHLIGKELLHLFNSCDLCVCNLEVPLTEHFTPIKKAGPNLVAHEESINGIKAMGINLVSLANNHIMDQGEQGLNNSIRVLNDAKIKHIGGGVNIAEARKPFIDRQNGKTIGFYACAEHEFSIASNFRAGANPVEILSNVMDIRQLKDETDYVIVLYHGGKEHYPYPSPVLQKNCRTLIDAGANLVICQHSHCIGCEERYKSGTIIYGQGNFIFDYKDIEWFEQVKRDRKSVV